MPAPHATQSPPSGPVYPALHVQSDAAALPAGELESVGQTVHTLFDVAASVVEYVPAPQSVQLPDPVSALWVPATHAEQALPSGPV